MERSLETRGYSMATPSLAVVRRRRHVTRKQYVAVWRRKFLAKHSFIWWINLVDGSSTIWFDKKVTRKSYEEQFYTMNLHALRCQSVWIKEVNYNSCVESNRETTVTLFLVNATTLNQRIKKDLTKKYMFGAFFAKCIPSNYFMRLLKARAAIFPLA